MATQIFCLKIPGMDCPSEAAQIEKRFKGTHGLRNLRISPLTGEMEVEVEPQVLELAQVLKVLDEIGLPGQVLAQGPGARPAAAAPSPAFDATKLGLTVLSGLGLLLGAIAHFWPALPFPANPLFAVSMVFGAAVIARKAFFAVKRFALDMNVLMLIAAMGATGIGQWFEGAGALFLFAVAQLLETYSLHRARSAVSALLNLRPPTVVRLQGMKEEQTAVADVRPSDFILSRPGERLSLDGVIREGQAGINESSLSGEATPVFKTVGDEVYAGTLNQDGRLVVEVTRPSGETRLDRVIALVARAQQLKTPTEQWVDRFARKYTPSVVLFALLVAIVPPLLGGDWGRWYFSALTLLVIACPCALVIATPVSSVCGLTAAARNGILIKGGSVLEKLAVARQFAFDKTGTVTLGEPRIVATELLWDFRHDELLRLACSLAAASEHHLSRAFRRLAAKENVAIAKVESFLSHAGLGISGVIDGKRYLLGSRKFLDMENSNVSPAQTALEQAQEHAQSVVLLGDEQQALGFFALEDALRQDAREHLEQLRRQGGESLVLLTGDSGPAAKRVATSLGLDSYFANLTPAHKLETIESLKKKGTVVMIGDGINDTPALAAADVGIAIGGTAADVALDSADVVLLADDLAQVAQAQMLGRRTLATMKLNIFLALGIKAVFVILALAGKVTLWMAVAGDMGVSLLVIFIALRLLNFQPGAKSPPLKPAAN